MAFTTRDGDRGHGGQCEFRHSTNVLQEALPLLARRMPNLRVDGPAGSDPQAVGIFGPAHMPVTFDAGH